MNQPVAVPLLPPTPVNLPVEVSLQVLGLLDRQTLGRIMVANRRLGRIVNRHRKTLNLPEIPVPPKLSVFLKLLVFLGAVALALLPFGISYAAFSTQSRLRTAGLVPETFHDVKRTAVPVTCITTCDAQLQCHEECTFEYTLLDERRGRITKRSCSSTGLPATNASLTSPVRWKCSFDYVLNEAPVDTKVSEVTFQWHSGAWWSLLLALLDLPATLLVLRADRKIADEYMAATQGRRRDRSLRRHAELRKTVIIAIVVALTIVGLCGSAVLYGMTLQSFSAVYTFFLSSLIVSTELGIIYMVVMIFWITGLAFCDNRPC